MFRAGRFLVRALLLALAAGTFAVPLAAQRITRAADKAPPAIKVASPAPGARIDTFTPVIEIAYDDEGSGVAVVSFRVTINGRDHSVEFEHHSQGATGKIAASNPLPLGENKITVELADRSGNVGRAESTFVNAGGGWLNAIADPGVGSGRHIELVFDASGSMDDKMLDNTRMDVAKGSVKNLIKALPADTPLGLRVFTACDNIRSLIPIATVDKVAFVATVDEIKPFGGTPIVASLLQSFDTLAKLQDVQRMTVLVTDGGESCSGLLKDAAEKAKEFAIRLIVITFDLNDQVTNRELAKLALDTGGAYFNAQNGAELQTALERSILRITYGVFDAQGKRVADGDVNGERLMLPIGTYQVRLDLSTSKVVQDVTIGSLNEVTRADAADGQRRHHRAGERSEAVDMKPDTGEGRRHLPLTTAVGLVVVMAMSGCGRACFPVVREDAASAPRTASSSAASGDQTSSSQGAGTSPVTISQRGPGAKGAADAALQLPVPRTFELNHVEPAHYAVALGKDPQRIFEFVRDRVAYEAYTGRLRGARGTLLAMAGNSVDRAALLADLLEKAGQKTRFARGTLSDVDAKDLVTSMSADRPATAPTSSETPSSALKAVQDALVSNVARDFQLIRSQIAKSGQSRVHEPGPTVEHLTQEAQSHYWVQWSKDGSWVDLDTAFADSMPGRTYASAQETLTALPGALAHRIGIRVVVEEYAILLSGEEATTPSRRELLRYAADAPDLAGLDLVLTHQPERWSGPTQNIQGAVAAAIEDTGRLKPVLLTGGDKWIDGEPFRAKPPAVSGLGGLGSLLGGAGTRRPVPIAVAEYIEFEFVAPSGKETVVREVFDLVGKSRRASGKTLSAEEVRTRTQATTNVDLTRSFYDLFFTAGRIDAAHLTNLAPDSPRKPGEPVDARATLQRTNIAFVAASDALLARLTPPDRPAVLFYPVSPRLQILEASAAGGKARISFDLRRTAVRGVSLDQSQPDTVFLAQIYRGVVEGTLERILLQYLAGEQARQGLWEVGISTSRVFERADAEGVPSVLLARDAAAWGGDAPEDTRARVREEVRNGQWVVIPQKGITVGQDARFAWWRIDPTSGVATAVTDEGLHQVSVNYMATEQGERWLVQVTVAGYALPAFEVGALELAVWVEVVMRTGGIMTRYNMPPGWTR